MLFLCILMNYFGREITASLELPGWFDSYGTFISAYMYGPISGAVIGVTSNVIFAYWGAGAALFSVVSIFIGVSVGIFANLRICIKYCTPKKYCWLSVKLNTPEINSE